MTPFEQRDAQYAEMIRREIDKCKATAKACDWQPGSSAWHRAFGELSGLHKALQLIDYDANNVLPLMPGVQR